MFNRFTTRSRTTATARELYGSIVTQSRREALFTQAGVPDTLEGRLELLLLHTALAIIEIGAQGGDGTLARAVSEAFVEDVDDNLREVGLSDLRVPAKVKRAAAALLERHDDYAAALKSGEAAFQDALAKHFCALPGGSGIDMAALARLAGERSGQRQGRAEAAPR